MDIAEIKIFAQEIYELCIDRGLTYADYRKVILELNKIKDSIACIYFEENGKKLLQRLG